jgi:hypothetical protein
VYGLPKDASVSELGRRWYSATWARHFQHSPVASEEGKKECIYIRDSSPFTEEDITDFVLEVERLNRPWKPQYHSSG